MGPDVRGVEADTLKYQRIRLTVDDNLVISFVRKTLEAAFVAVVNTRLVARAALFRNHFLSLSIAVVTVSFANG